MIHILDGVRPEKPDLSITRGYTDELWEMTTSCWEEDSIKRPTVDFVLGVLGSTGERWKFKNGEFSAQDDWGLTPLTDGSESEHENESVIFTASVLLNHPQPPAIKIPVPVPVPLTPTTTPPVPILSTAEDETPPKTISATPSKEKIKPAPVSHALASNLPTPPCSNNVLQTTPSTKLSVSGVQPQSTSGLRPALDEVVDRILVRAKSPLGEDEARKIVEALEKVSKK